MDCCRLPGSDLPFAMASNDDPEGSWNGRLPGFPKIARSADFLSFQTTAPALVNSPSFSPNNAHPVMRFGVSDKLWLDF